MKDWFERALNRYLTLDPASKERMLHLQDKIILIELRGTPFCFRITFADGKAHVSRDQLINADITIKGTPLSLLNAGLLPEQRSRFFAEDVMVEGNMELAQNVLAIFDELEIDWEEILSHWIGDPAAYKAGSLIRDVKQFAKRFHRTMTANVNEYIHEEINFFPSKEALSDFFANGYCL